MNRFVLYFLVFLKSLLDAIGTSSGLSWPALGLFTGALFLSAGSTFMIGLCITAATIFTVVTTYIFIASFINNIKEKKAIDEDYEHYKQSAYNKVGANNVLNYLDLHKKSTPFFVKLTAFILTFAGVHGTIAGTTLGVISLLISLGAIPAGFAGFPIVAGIALGTALVSSVILGIIAIAQASQNYQKKKEIDLLKKYLEPILNNTIETTSPKTALPNPPANHPSPIASEQNSSLKKRKNRRNSLSNIPTYNN